MSTLTAARPADLVGFAAALAEPVAALRARIPALEAALAAVGPLPAARPAGAVLARRLADHGRATEALAHEVAAVGLAFAAAGGPAGTTSVAVRSLDGDAVAPIVAAVLGIALDAAPGATSQRDPDEVRRLAALLGPAALAGLAATHPTLVGSVDGMPPDARCAANRVLLGRALAAAEAAGDAEGAADLRALLAPGRRILVFDPAGDGRVAEVLGAELATAEAIAVVVPGMGNSLATFESGTAAKGRAVAAAAGDGTAVVAWLGYDSPEGASAALDDASLPAAHRLVRLLDGLPDGALRTVVGHSYGSVVAAQALRAGLEVDQVVVTGSPGMLAPTAAALGDVPIYAARAPFDAVGWSEAFGRDPVDPRFGAIELETGAVVGHAGYFDAGSESLANIGRVVSGRADRATVVAPPAVEVAVGAVADLQAALDPTDVAQAAAAQASADVGRALDRISPRLPAPVGEVLEDVRQAAGTALEVADGAVDLAQRLTSVDLLGDVAGDAAQVLGDLLGRGR